VDSTFTANTIANLPLNGLDFSALTLYVPGAVFTAGTSGPTSFERSTYYTDLPNLNGNRAQANNYTLEGIDMIEDYNNLISYSPAPEALEQVQVITADSPTTYGNMNGAAVVSILKTGTNQFHGSAYGYVQNYRFNANSYSNGQTNPVTPINPFSFSQFGGTLGGPILHDKLFFFVDYLGSRWHKGGEGTASVMPDAMRNGDFPTWFFGSTWVHTFSPNLVNSARAGFTRTKWSEGLPQDPTGFFGTSGNAKVGITFPGQAYEGFTNQNLSDSNMSNVGTAAYNGNNLIDNTYSYYDNLSWQRGKHYLSFGAQGIRYQNNHPTGNNDGYLGSLNYSGARSGTTAGFQKSTQSAAPSHVYQD
jgi:hypothetical protein